MDRDKVLTSTAKAISVAFHPIMIPVYGMLIILSSHTIYGYMPFSVKRILLFVILVNNVIVPLSLMPWFRYRNFIRSWSCRERTERYVPLIATSFFYSVSVYIFWRFHLPLFIKAYILTTALIAIAVTIINFRYKISIHSTGAGAMVMLILILSFRMDAQLLALLILSLIGAGLVLSSRLLLDAHDPKEVWGGFMLGLLGSLPVLLFLG